MCLVSLDSVSFAEARPCLPMSAARIRMSQFGCSKAVYGIRAWLLKFLWPARADWRELVLTPDADVCRGQGCVCIVHRANAAFRPRQCS